MQLTVDDRTGERIQRELDRGHFRRPSELIERALDLLEAQEDWLRLHREEIEEHLRRGVEQIERGEGVGPERAREMLAERRLARQQG